LAPAALVVERATAGWVGIDKTAGPLARDRFEGVCPVCGCRGVFVCNERSFREGYLCSTCRSSLRSQGQADALLRLYSMNGSSSLSALVEEPAFAALRIWEPGLAGPLRKHLRRLPGYVQTAYEPDVAGGDYVDGLRCEDLMALTFPDDSFDLIITSDILEHVRRPYAAFRELHRVLSPGGRHVFSIPLHHPLPSTTVERVDTSGDVDRHLAEPHFHYGPGGSTHLVYNDFGQDLLDRLDRIGFETTVLHLDRPSNEASRLVTFASLKR
jgi:SAM-dependent methyltransferase